MAGLVTKLVARKIFAEKLPGNKQNQANGAVEDPYFETVPATRLGMKTTKKRKRALPPGLTPDEEAVLNKAKKRAYRLDLCLFSLCGLRFGWSSVIGLIPAVGDVADVLLALLVFRTMCSVEPPLSTGTKTKMQMNIVIDFVVGLVPFIGDLADAAFKCNTKNVILFEDELRERGKKRIRQSGQVYPAHDPSLADEYDYQDHEQGGRGDSPPGYTSRQPSRRDRQDQDRRDRSRSRRDRRDDRDLESARGITPPRPARTR